MTAGEGNRLSNAFTATSVPDNYQRHLAPVVFEPWAEVLMDAVGVGLGAEVLDVASGTGVVARLAAQRAGTDGRVVAVDVSGPMLKHAAAQPRPAGSAPIEFLESGADHLPCSDGSFDVVLCQQGLQFFDERLDAVREMRRVLRAGGVAGASVWAAGHRLEPFDDYIEALSGAGVEPPFPHAFESATYAMGADETGALFEDAGFGAVEVSTVELTISFADADSAAAGILGTPFGPVVAALPPDRREAVDSDLTRRFAGPSPGAPVRRATAAVIVRATAPS
jgi:ubiquinone/menaquinone biosynthesis C-methylase UbiE